MKIFAWKKISSSYLHLNVTSEWYKSLIKLILIIFLFNSFFFALPVQAFADDITDSDFFKKFIGKTGYTTAGVNMNTPTIIAARTVQILLGFLGIIFIILIIYAGFQWMTAGGNEEKVKKAREIMKNAIIGLTIVLTAYIITTFIFYYFFSPEQTQEID